MNKPQKALTTIIITTILIITGFSIFTITTSYKPDQRALESMRSSYAVTVENTRYISFIPSDSESKTGFIYYPGGKVEPEAYAPYARALASEGIPTFIANMPLNLAILDMSAADRIINEHKDIDTWIVGGHSLGGAMASSYAYKNQDKVHGLVLLGAYPVESADFSQSDMDVLMLIGSNDAVIDRENLTNAMNLLPKDARRIDIDGGNHSQFGFYGFQDGDSEAGITYDEQVSIVVSEILEWIEGIE